MSNKHTLDELWVEIVRRMSDEALLFLIDMGREPISWSQFETKWKQEKGDKSYFDAKPTNNTTR
jgi:hypothetical protein